METIADRVRACVVRQLGVRESNIFRTATLGELAKNPEDLIWLFRHIEMEFGIEIPYADENSLETVEDLFSYVEEMVIGKRFEKPHLDLVTA